VPEESNDLQIGEKVAVILSADVDVVYLVGFGVYEGEDIPPMDIMGPNNIAMARFKQPQAKLKLEDGTTVWGCEVYFGSRDVP